MHLGNWKIEKIIEAGGNCDEARVRDDITSQVSAAPIAMLSFHDCRVSRPNDCSRKNTLRLTL